MEGKNPQDTEVRDIMGLASKMDVSEISSFKFQPCKEKN